MVVGGVGYLQFWYECLSLIKGLGRYYSIIIVAANSLLLGE